MRCFVIVCHHCEFRRIRASAAFSLCEQVAQRTMQALFEKLTKRNAAHGAPPHAPRPLKRSTKLLNCLNLSPCASSGDTFISQSSRCSVRERLPIIKFSPGLFQKAAFPRIPTRSPFPRPGSPYLAVTVLCFSVRDRLLQNKILFAPIFPDKLRAALGYN